MPQFHDQQAVIANLLLKSVDKNVKADPQVCKSIWDSENARICPQFLNKLPAIPLAIALTIIVYHAICLLITYRPIWTQPFVEEVQPKNEGLIPRFRRGLSSQVLCLLFISLLGLILEIFVLFRAGFQLSEIFLALTWICSFFLVSVLQPVVASKSLLLLYSSVFVVQATVTAQSPQTRHLIASIQIFAGFFACLTIFCTPMRNPYLPIDEISPVYGAPTFELRSPEDNLMLWQYLSVSWMAPLISLGKQRQLNDEDVWTLAYEFKHRFLHDKFKEMKGSLLSKLVRANGIDLVLQGVFGIIALVANLSTPVLLQQLLRSMEDPDIPRSASITYAVLSLAARLIAAQLGVFLLWHGRRAYERSRGEMITMLYEKTLSRKIVGINQDSKESASMGKILNLMRNDAYEIAQRFWEFMSLVTTPLGMIFAGILLWQILGWPSLVGIAAVLVGQLLNAVFARYLIHWETKRRTATDIKLQKVSQFVESIRHLRWYGWQNTWLARIMGARQDELNLRVITGLWNTLIFFTNMLASSLCPFFAFYAYTALAGKELRVDIAFPALQIFAMLEENLRQIPGLITVMLNARVSINRIDEFMAEPEVDAQISEGTLVLDRAQANESTESTETSSFELKDASFSWPGHSDQVLQKVSVSFPRGLTVICGEVGAGKTALLESMLGELDQKEGETFHMKEAVGYCAQRPWLQSMSIRDNILFSAPYEEERYKEILESCALEVDMLSFEHGDRSHIGENGIGLSGGQRARVALARAVYSNAQVLFLDDPISALDHQTAEFVMNKCIAGDLTKDRTVILVTHRTEICHGLARQILVVSNGSVRVADIGQSFIQNLTAGSDGQDAKDKVETKEPVGVATKFIEDEHRAHGGVKSAVYWEYVKAGKLRWWFLLIILMTFWRLVNLSRGWYLKEWGEGYNDYNQKIFPDPLRGLPSPNVNVMPWLIGFALIAVVEGVIFIIAQFSMLVIIYMTGRRMFKDVISHVSHATFRFYDVTPVGRLMNRMTSDINTIDGNISNQFRDAAFQFITWVMSLAIIATATPIFLVCAIIFTTAFVVIFLHFLPTSQSLRRLEMVSLTPLISNFGALVEGLTTVRAFRAQSRFLNGVIAVTDNFQKMDHFYWSLQAWLSYRFDTLSAISTLVLTIIAIYSNISPGLTAFVLVACSNFVQFTHALCRTYGQLQMDFVSVERVVELLHVDQEAAGAISPPAWWPSLNGDIEFQNVTLRYAPHFEPALSDLSLRIRAGSSTAIIGRTGSGKSTLAMALLAAVTPESGKIILDNVDIADIDKQTLRERVTFVAQDPVLFPGSMRQNLDPMEEYSGSECHDVLEKIAGRHQWNLETEIEAGGRNLSQGQRQLIGLARTLLRRSQIVILDEATASIDRETAQSIQDVLHEEMKGKTVITIAHRLEAVKNADYCIVLGKGRLIRQGRAADILKEDGASFVEAED